MKRIIMAAMIVSLAACGGDKDDVATEQQQEWESQNQSLVYSFPDNNQQEVPVPSPVVLRFSSPVMETSPAVVLREVGGPVVSDFEMEWVDGKRGLIITPDSKLKPMTDYMVQVPAIELEKGVAPAKNIRFSTRALFEGPKSLVASDTFEVTRMIPDGENYQVMDFSSFRVQFSQPLDQTTVKYGDGADATVQLMGPEGVVDAHLLVSGHYMTIDPKEDLTPGAEYSLNMTTGITSTYGETLPGGSFGNPGDTLAVSVKVSPQDTKAPGTGLRVSMVQDVADTGELSPLTGQPINLVPMASVLLGEDTATQASGTIAAELAFVPNFPEATPFRVKRGSLIEGASIEVLIGGEVPAGFESGKVRMDFLSDATGYLLPNPYSNSDDAPRQVRLFMDVAVSTETPSANGAITQDLLHIELVGTSIVEDGVMVINAVGVVEPNVLGSERAKGILSFYMKANEDQDRPPAVPLDETAPELQSWVPGEDLGNFSPTDTIIFKFSEPLDKELVNGDTIKVLENGMPYNFSMTINGSSIIIETEYPLKKSVHSTLSDTEDFLYEIKISNGIFDLSGNEYQGQDSFSFSLPAEVIHYTHYQQLDFTTSSTDPGWSNGSELNTPNRSPLVLYMMPGFPCVLEPSTISTNQRIAGRCSGALSNTYVSATGNIKRVADDLLPIQSLPSNRPIVVIFSREIDPQSLKLGESFIVEEQLESGAYSSVDGSLDLDGKRLTFYPSYPWKEDVIYRYTLRSNGDDMSAVNQTICDGTQAICDINGQALQTKLYDTSLTIQPPDMISLIASPDAGGPDMTQYFIGARKTSEVFMAMVGPSADENANFWHENNMTERPMLGMLEGYIANYKEYIYQERGAENMPLDTAAHLLDPDGVLPPDNSAKLVSLDIGEADTTYTGPFLNGLSVGCGWYGVTDFNDPDEPRVPFICPQDKFTYLTSAIGAEVTTEYTAGKGLKVNIWPGQIMSTSINIYTMIQGVASVGLPSGPQLMRMRYAKEDPYCVDTESEPCLRNRPISAWIKTGQNGEPMLEAEVDVYVDAIGLFGSLAETPLAGLTHNMSSVPATLLLEGKVEFLNDGRMRVEQRNINDVNLGFEIEYSGVSNGGFDLIVPSGGSKLVYWGDVVK